MTAPIDHEDAEISPSELAELAVAGGAFDWLADELDLYDDTCGEAIVQ